MSWNLSKEICELLLSNTVPEGLLAAGIIENGDEFAGLSVVSDWHRSGAETYLLVFDVLSSNQDPKRLALKACTPSVGSGVALKVIMSAWLRRRSVLSAAGVSTPTLYGSGDGLILEEFVPLSLLEALEEQGSVPLLISDAAMALGTVQALGFRPVSILSDFRSRGSDVVMIDFGADLGDPTYSPSVTVDSDPDLGTLIKMAAEHDDRLASAAIHAYRLALAGQPKTVTPL